MALATRLHKLRNAPSFQKSANHRDESVCRLALFTSPSPCFFATTSYRFVYHRPKGGLIPFDPNDTATSGKAGDLRTPYVPPIDGRDKSLWKRTKDGAKNSVSTVDDRRRVNHPSLFYREDHEDKSWLFRSNNLAGHDYYKGYRPRSNTFILSLSILALLVHFMTREENDIDEIVQKQGWYRLLWLNAPYDSSKDPRSNKEVGKTIIGVPLISPQTLLNNTKDE